MSTCIWCKKTNQASSLEHIIPEVVGCPEGFVLSNGEVCRSCNNTLGRVDRAVAHEFDFVLHHFNIPGKRGKPPEIRSRGNVVATSAPHEISFNMDAKPAIAHDGSRLGSFGRSDRNVAASFEVQGEFTHVSYDVEFGKDTNFVRGVVKIAFETLAFFLGGEFALDPQFDKIRQYVLDKKGKRSILIREGEDMKFKNQAWPPYIKAGEYAVVLRLAMAEFFVDLGPSHKLVDEIRSQSLRVLGEKGWTQLPLNA